MVAEPSKCWALVAAGCASAAIALLHVFIIFVGAPGYRYFGAGEEIARLAESGSPYPALLTAFVTIFFVLFAVYGLAGAQLLPWKPPLLRTGLVAIGAIYSLRGVLLAPQAAAFSSGGPLVGAKDLVFSSVSLAIGLLYLWGTWRAWPALSRPKWRAA